MLILSAYPAGAQSGNLMLEKDGITAREGETLTAENTVCRRLFLTLPGNTVAEVDAVKNPEKEQISFRFSLPSGDYRKEQGQVCCGKLRILVPTAFFDMEGGVLTSNDTHITYRGENTYLTVFTEDKNLLAGNALCGTGWAVIRLAYRGYTECFVWKYGESVQYHREEDPIREVLGGRSDEEFLAEQRARFSDLYGKENAVIAARGQDKGYVKSLLERAEDGMQGLYVLPGTFGKKFCAGNPPAWKEPRVTDEEYLWSLVRFPEMKHLTEAYLVTGEERYGARAILNMESFLDTVPPYSLENLDDRVYLSQAYSDGTVNPWRQLEAGIRLFDSWRIFYRRMLHSPLMTPAFHTRFAVSVYQHMRQLRIASPVLWPNGAHNHYLHEMLGLLSGAAMFPTFAESKDWTAFSMREIERCGKAQIMDDGAQLEGSPKYHNICIDLFLVGLQIASEVGLKFSEEMNRRLDAAMEHSAWFFSPACICSAIGDSIATDILVPAITEKYYSATGSFGAYAKIAGLSHRPSREVISDEVLAEAAAKRGNYPGGIKAFRSVGEVFGRTGWNPGDSWFSFLCKTPIYNGHAHADPGSVELVLEGKEIVVDPGAPTYEFGEMRKRYVSAPYHSCLTFGEREPFVLVRHWVYSEQKPGFLKGIYEGDGFVGADAEQHNFAPAVQKRLVLLIGKKTFLVADDTENPDGEAVHLWFHMADPAFTLTGEGAKSGDLRILSTVADRELIPSDRDSGRWGIVPSVRFRATDSAPAKRGLYLHIITTDINVCHPAISAGNDGVRISFTDGKGEENFLWKYGESVRKEK